MTLFRAACHLLCSALLSATNRVTPSDILSNMAFFLTHTSFEFFAEAQDNVMAWYLQRGGREHNAYVACCHKYLTLFIDIQPRHVTFTTTTPTSLLHHSLVLVLIC